MGTVPLFVIVGAPAVGKSSTAQAVAARFDRSVHIPVDDLRHMVRRGLELPDPRWTEPLREQVELARRAALDMADRYRRAGFAAVLDDFVDPHELSEYALPGEDVVRVCLRPDQQTAHARNRGRATNEYEIAYLDRGIATIYEFLGRRGPALEEAGWAMIDTTRMTVEEAAQRVIELWPTPGRPGE